MRRPRDLEGGEFDGKFTRMLKSNKRTAGLRTKKMTASRTVKSSMNEGRWLDEVRR